MIVATAATLFVNKIPLTSGEAAAMAIEPFAGKLAGTLFALGILNAGFMGMVIVALSTAYAFKEFFGLSGSLDSKFKQSKSFYWIYFGQIIVALSIAILPGVSLFKLAIVTQTINAVVLPLVLYFLIKLASNPALMGKYVNTRLQKLITIGGAVMIAIASVVALAAVFIHL